MHQTHPGIGISIVVSPGFIFGKIPTPRCGLTEINLPGRLAGDFADRPRGATLSLPNSI